MCGRNTYFAGEFLTFALSGMSIQFRSRGTLAMRNACINKLINDKDRTKGFRASANPFQTRIKSLCPFWPRQHPSQLWFLYGLSNN